MIYPQIGVEIEMSDHVPADLLAGVENPHKTRPILVLESVMSCASAGRDKELEGKRWLLYKDSGKWLPAKTPLDAVGAP